jgi:hypothetical protein
LSSCMASIGAGTPKPASIYGIKCVYSPDSFTPSPTTTVQVTLSTNNAPGSGNAQSRLPVAAWFVLVGGVFVGLFGTRSPRRSWLKRRLAFRAIGAFGIVLLMLSLGCGGGFNNTAQGNGTTGPGIYNISIVGTSPGTEQPTPQSHIRTYAVVQLTVLKQ